MFPQRLKKLRIRHGLTMKMLAEKLNVAPSTISGYENGKRKPDMDTLAKLADYFQSSTDYLLGRTDNPYTGNPSIQDDIFYQDQMTAEEIDYLRESLAVFRKYREHNNS